MNDYPRVIIIRCRHCGAIAVTDPSVIRGTVDIVRALQQGHAPLGAMTCPLCHDEVRARDVELGDDAGHAVAPVADNLLATRPAGPWDGNAA